METIRFIDYIDIIKPPEMTERQKWDMRKAVDKLVELSKRKKTKMLVVDSECVWRGHIGFKEIG